MQSIEYNKENHPILNHIYNIYYIQAELQTQGKIIILCKVPAHIGNEKADKATKQAIDVPGITTTRLPYIDYYLAIGRARKFKWLKKWENSTSKLH